MPKKRIQTLEEKKKIDALKAETTDAGHVIEGVQVIIQHSKEETLRRIGLLKAWIATQACMALKVFDFGKVKNPPLREERYENGKKVIRVLTGEILSFDEALESPSFFDALYSVTREGFGDVFSRLLHSGSGRPGLFWTLEPWWDNYIAPIKGGNGSPEGRNFQARTVLGQAIWHPLNAHAVHHGIADQMPTLHEMTPKSFSEPGEPTGISSTDVVNPNNTPEKSQAKADQARGAM